MGAEKRAERLDRNESFFSNAGLGQPGDLDDQEIWEEEDELLRLFEGGED